MIRTIIHFSIQNKFVIGLMMLAWIAWGSYSMLRLPIDAVPDITNNQVQVVTVSPALAPEEIEQFITYPIEMVLANVQGVEAIRSVSRYGLSVVTVVFDDHFPVLDARQLVGEMLEIARGEIPAEYGSPELMPITTGLGEIYQYTLELAPGYEHRYGATDLREIHDWIVKRQLAGIPGIVEVSSFGGFLKQFEVAVDPQRLQQFDVGLDQLHQALMNNNQNTGGSYVQQGPYAWYVRAQGLLQDTTQIGQTVVATRNGVPILLRQVADVRIGYPTRFGAMTKDGRGETVGGITLMLKGANANQVLDQVKERIAAVQQSLPEGVHIRPYLDRSELVGRVIGTLGTNLAEAALIVVAVLVLLLGNWRAGLLVGSVIPLSLLFAFGLMRSFGVSASVMSLGAIDFGLIVDGTIIIVEGILFYLHRHLDRRQLSQSEMDAVVLEASDRVGKSAGFGILIILIVYFPILALTGIEGKMFRPMALTIAFALVGALVLSITYVPAFSAQFFSKQVGHAGGFADRLIEGIGRGLMPVVDFAFRFKRSVLLVAAALFAGSLVLLLSLGAEFIPNLEEGDLAMQMTVAPGSSLDESIRQATKAEALLMKHFPEVVSVVSKIGTAEVPTDPMAIEDADVMIILKPKDQWTSARTRDELADRMKQRLGSITGADFNFTQPIQLRFNELITGAKSDVVVKIFGEDLGLLAQKAEEVARLAEQVPGAADVKVELVDGLPQLLLRYKHHQLAQHGLQVATLNQLVNTALAGQTAGVVFEGERKFDIALRLAPQYRNNLDALKQLPVNTPAGYRVPLGELVDISQAIGPMQIVRDNTHRRIVIGINVRNRDVKSLVHELRSRIDQSISLPPGYSFAYGGQFENLETAMSRLQIVLPIALGLIFLLLFFTFGSIKMAAVVFVTIPLSVVGGIAALWLRGLPFSISAGIGFIALFGVAVLNGIVLINQFNRLRSEYPQDELAAIIRRGVHAMLRPIVLTTLVASLGFIPMAVSTQAGAEVQQPLATVVIGGLLVSSLLSLALVPIVYFYAVRLGRGPKPKAAVAALMLLFAAMAPAKAQTDTVLVNLPQAQAIALRNSLVLRNAQLSVEQAAANKAAQIDLGPTEIDYQHGQINGQASDYALSIRQNFGGLLRTPALRAQAQAQKKMSQLALLQAQAQLHYDVSVAYYQWQQTQQHLALVQRQLALYQQVAHETKLRHQHGEATLLEHLRSQQRHARTLLLLADVRADSHNHLLLLNNVLNTDTLFRPESSELNPCPLPEMLSDEQTIHRHGLWQASEGQVDWLQRSLAVQRSQLLPEFSAGVFRQQIEGTDGFGGIELGVSLPLWFWPQHQANRMARIELEKARNDQDNLRIDLRNQLIAQQQHIRNHYARLQLFQQDLLQQANEIEQSAQTLYRSGQIDFDALVQSIDEALALRREYIDTLFQYNQAVCFWHQMLLQP